MNIQVIDNFIDEEHFAPLRYLFSDGDIPWNWTNNITGYGKDPESEKRGQLEHVFYRTNTGIYSKVFELLHPVLEKFQKQYGDLIIYRIKANLNPKEDQNYRLGDFHVDFNYRNKTAIFYINTNNGYTEFETGQKVESVENRMVIFDSHIQHVGYACTDQKSRVVVNFNFAIPEAAWGIEHDNA